MAGPRHIEASECRCAKRWLGVWCSLVKTDRDDGLPLWLPAFAIWGGVVTIVAGVLTLLFWGEPGRDAGYLIAAIGLFGVAAGMYRRWQRQRRQR